MNRISKKELEGMFNRFCMMWKRVKGGEDVYRLDYIACYGGYMVVKDLDKGGESAPFTSRRYNLKEMYHVLDFACSVLEGLYYAREFGE